MKNSNGNILIVLGCIHSLFGVTPLAFSKQFARFSDKFFINISGGILEFPFINGDMNYETMAAFWFFYFGLLMIPLGLLIKTIEKSGHSIPGTFIWSYLVVILIGVLMIPYSGMTLFLLPHAICMIYKREPTLTTK